MTQGGETRKLRRQKIGDDAGAQLMAGRQVDRDVATVVDIGFVECAAADHRFQHFIGHGARDGGHRRDVDRTMRPHCVGHASRDRALQQRIGLADRPAQRGQLAYQRRQDVTKALDRLLVGEGDFIAHTERLDQKIDRTMLQMQAAVGQSGDLRTGHRSSSSTLTLPPCASMSSRLTAREA